MQCTGTVTCRSNERRYVGNTATLSYRVQHYSLVTSTWSLGQAQLAALNRAQL